MQTPNPSPPADTVATRPAPHVLLRVLREVSGLTQQGWATLLGYSAATVRRWENGTAGPTAEAEQALLAQCQQQGLFRTFEQEPVRGFILTPEVLRDLLAEARLRTSRPHNASTGATSPPEVSDALEPPAALAPADPTRATPDLPSGTVTFLFTDLEGHTPLWETHPEAMRSALARHDAILRRAVRTHNGHVVKGRGDGVHAAFARAADAVGAALDAQRALATEASDLPRPLRARMGLHTGACEERDGDYFGPAVNRAARIMQAASGGQVLLSQITARLARTELSSGTSLRDLGEHQFKGLHEPERLFQLIAPDLPDQFPPLLSQSAPKHNLPMDVTPLIGREHEVATIKQQLLDPHVRLVTVTGTGGTGKTRVALHVAAELLGDFRDGVFFVPLAAIEDPALVIGEIGRWLGVQELPGADLISKLKEFLHAKEMLLVLDNFEQVLSAADSVSDLVAACASLKVLVTSRVRLRLYGEQEIPLAPLRAPVFPWPPLDELTQFDSVRLFIERARGVTLDFHVNQETASSIAEICARLDGLPLAIELAASRVKLLPPLAMSARLQHRLKLLVGGPRDRDPRQQTLRNTLDWSYQLLSSAHQALFRQMGVFAGGWSLDAAQAVYQNATGGNTADVDVLDGLDALIDASLVRQESSGEEPRFSMLEIVREYALEQLAANGEAESTRARHVAYFVGLGEQARPHLSAGAEHYTWLQRLRLERDNLRSALRWCLEIVDIDRGLRLGAAVSRFWLLEGVPGEGGEWLQAILRLASGAGQSVVRCAALIEAAALANARGDFVTAQPLLEESLSIARHLQDQRQIELCLHNLGMLAAQRGEMPEARRLLEETAAMYLTDPAPFAALPFAAITYRVLGRLLAEQGDFAGSRTWLEMSLAAHQQLKDETGVASCLGIMGFIAAVEGDMARAEAMCEQALRHAREYGDPNVIAWNFLDLAAVRLFQCNYSEVTKLCSESLTVRSASVKSRERVAVALQLLGAVAVGCGRFDRALRLFGAASMHYEVNSPAFWLWDRLMRERQQSARSSLPGATVDAAFEAGRAMTIDEAIEYGVEAVPTLTETTLDASTLAYS